jgi:hypothetical protein
MDYRIEDFPRVFAPRGICFCVFGSSKFQDAFKEKIRLAVANTEESSQYKHEN